MVNMLKVLLLGFIMLVVSAQDTVIPCTGKDDCCDGILCGINEGDCDSHDNCAGHLRCGVDNCKGDSFDSTDDCCWEDPLFPPPGPEIDYKMCETRWRFQKNIVHAASALGCDFAKGAERDISISLDECSQISCSAEAIGKSFTCNNQNKEKACMELLNLHADVQDRINTQCKQMLRTECDHSECAGLDNCCCVVGDKGNVCVPTGHNLCPLDACPLVCPNSWSCTGESCPTATDFSLWYQPLDGWDSYPYDGMDDCMYYNFYQPCLDWASSNDEHLFILDCTMEDGVTIEANRCSECMSHIDGTDGSECLEDALADYRQTYEYEG